MSTYNHFTAKPSYLFGSPLVPQPSLILRLVFIIDHGYQLQFDYLLGLCPLRWWIENVEARRVQPTGSDPSMVNRTYVDGRVQVSDPQFFLVRWLCNITKIHVGLLDDLIMSRPVFFLYALLANRSGGPALQESAHYPRPFAEFIYWQHMSSLAPWRTGI